MSRGLGDVYKRQRSYCIFEECLMLANNSSRPSAEKHGSKMHGARCFGSPMHEISPFVSCMLYISGLTEVST